MESLSFGLREVIVVLVGVGAIYVLLVRGAFRILHTPAAGRTSPVREATAFESWELGSQTPPDVWAFDAWSYRVGGRFAGRVRVVLSDSTLTVAGPRVPRPIYALWVWVQAASLAGAITALVASVAFMSWAVLAWFGAFIGVSVAVSLLGAGLWPGLGEMGWVVSGRYEAVDVPLAAVSDVTLGKGWSRGGFDEVLFLYRAGVDQVAKGRAVSFFGPDEGAHMVRFALHMGSDEAAIRLVEALSEGGR